MGIMRTADGIFLESERRGAGWSHTLKNACQKFMRQLADDFADPVLRRKRHQNHGPTGNNTIRILMCL